MTNSIAPAIRAGQTDVARGTEQTHTLIVYVQDRPGAVDRVVSLLRRRRANMQTLVLGRSNASSDVVRITIVVIDSEVSIEQLTEQIRKVVDVQQVINLSAQQTIARVLALIKVSSTPANFNTIIEHGLAFHAHVVDTTGETVTLEVVGSEEQIERLIDQLHPYGIRDIARSGAVAISRGL